ARHRMVSYLPYRRSLDTDEENSCHATWKLISKPDNSDSALRCTQKGLLYLRTGGASVVYRGRNLTGLRKECSRPPAARRSLRWPDSAHGSARRFRWHERNRGSSTLPKRGRGNACGRR